MTHAEAQPESSFQSRILTNVTAVLVGKEAVTRLALAGILAGGHILLEDAPGTGKTMLARALAISLGLGFKRVQFTPDLLPSDVTGVSVYRSGEFVFMPGTSLPACCWPTRSTGPPPRPSRRCSKRWARGRCRRAA